MTDWPAELPAYLLRDGYSESRQEGTVRSNMDQGAAKIRGRYTATVLNITGTVQLTLEQTSVLDAFYRDDIARGSLPFNWFHPRTREAVSMRLVKAPTYTTEGYAFRAHLELEILP